MRTLFACVLTAAVLLHPTHALADDDALQIQPETFETSTGTRVEAERGTLWVPENRSRPDSRRIKLEFVRFPATRKTDAAPIVYLAGGPGGSGIEAARHERFPLFMALREVADVIAFDQRGTGSSNSVPSCDAGSAYPLDQPLTRASVIDFMRKQAPICAAFWAEAGVDLAGYTTWESAADLDALRQALGAEKLNLWGISYGSHLGLATIKRYPEHIERAVFSSIEDLHETVKLPALTDAYFARVQAVINADADNAARYPDLAATMREVFASLDAEPAQLEVRGANGEPVQLSVGAFDLQLLVSMMISDPQGMAHLPAMFEGLKTRSFGPLAQILHDRVREDFGRYSNGMSTAMDLASGISTARLAEVEQQARTALLGDALNYPMPQLIGLYGVADLGEDFRAQSPSDVPTLFLSGTLDGRTYPESAADTARRFSRGQHLVIENAGHNLFMLAPEISEVIVDFFQGKPTEGRVISLPAPRFEG
jgi:pimeloyl-ACP methyl ester carboxylesterase